MSEYSSLKATIDANIKANNNQEITGLIMNSVLNEMVNSLGTGYQFMGVATPTNPGTAQTPDYKCFYLATTPGTYTYLGGLVVADGEVAILKYDTSWTKEVTGAVTAAQVNQLAGWIFGKYLDGLGQEQSFSDALCTTFLKATDGVVCQNLVAFTGSGYGFIFFYDSNYKFLGLKKGELNTKINYTLSTSDFPEGTVFFRVHSILSYNPNVANISSLYREALLANQYNKLNNWIDGEYIDANGGIAYYTYVKRSNYIVLKEDISYNGLSAMTGSGNGYLFFYDKNLNYISKLTGTPGEVINGTIKSSDIPSGAVYFRVHADLNNNAYLETRTPSISEYYPIDTKEVCYVSTDGNDNNDGSLSKPFATFQKAINEGYKKIIGMPGIYRGQNLWASGISGLDISCYQEGGLQDTFIDNVKRTSRIILDNSVVVSGLEAYDTIYRVELSVETNSKWYKVFISHELQPESTWYRSTSYNAILWEIGESLSSNKKMLPVLSLNDCKNTPGSFYYDGTYLYVCPTTTLVQYRRLINDNEDSDLFTITGCNDVKISGIDFMFMSRRGLYVYNSENINVQDCDFGFSAYWSNFETNNVNCTVERCNSYKSRIDGFGAIGCGDLSLYDCTAFYNYDDGVSHHYNTTGKVVGGEYSGNTKGGVTPSYGSRVDIDGVLCKDNGYGIYYLQSALEDSRVTDYQCRVCNSVAVDNVSKDIKTVGYNISIFNCGYDTSEFDTGKTTDVYNCHQNNL